MGEEYRTKSVLGSKKNLVLERHPNCSCCRNLGLNPAPLKLLENLWRLHPACCKKSRDIWKMGGKGEWRLLEIREKPELRNSQKQAVFQPRETERVWNWGHQSGQLPRERSCLNVLIIILLPSLSFLPTLSQTSVCWERPPRFYLCKWLHPCLCNRKSLRSSLCSSSASQVLQGLSVIACIRLVLAWAHPSSCLPCQMWKWALKRLCL